MYQNLLYAVKRRILDEVERAFDRHPAFTDKVKVYNKFPYEERVQYGAVLRNTSSSQIRLSPDNFISDLTSHCRLARQTDYPGTSIEWIRENSWGITGYMKEEDVSSQLSSTQRMFFTQYPMLQGPANTSYVVNPIGQVQVTVDGVSVFPEYVNGEKRVVMLRQAPADGVEVKVSYFYRTLSDPAIWVIDFVEDNQFIVAPIYTVDNKLLVEKSNGTETTVNLGNTNVDSGSVRIYMKFKGGLPTYLVNGTDYSVDLSTGIITLLSPLSKNTNLYGSYRWQPTNYNNGPYTFEPYQENHVAIPGVVLCISRRAQKNDRMVIIVSQEREQQAKIYGGHWDMSMELAVISKDPIQCEEMTDHLVSQLWGERKNVLEFEGITFNTVEASGESEESFVESTGDVYYIHNISISLMSEWQSFVPYLFKIEQIIPDLQVLPTTIIYNVDSRNNLTIDNLAPADWTVVKYPVVGYEKLT